MSFSKLGLSEDVLRAVADAGYTEPTPIQAQAIPIVLMGRDVLGLAQTGTGKTASFTLPMIDILTAGRAKARMPRSLILEPTRELATQVAENFKVYGKYHKLSKALLIGGVSITEQQKVLDRGADVLIATPGRLLDLFERGKILLSDVKILVIDETDRMLDMGFIPDVERIVKTLPRIRQTLFFSATFPAEIRRLAEVFLINPKEISVTPQASTADTVKDFIAVVEEKDKRAAMRSLLHTEDVRSALIFCNRKRDVDVLYRSLKKHGFNAAALHGDMAQAVRTRTLDAFRNDEITLLVCSDVAARGLDISDMSHVFNFDVPYNAEDYVHRIGRTGRAGREGRAFTLAVPEDGKYVAAINALIGREIPEIEIDGVASARLLEDGDSRRRGRRTRGDQGRGSRGDDGRRARRKPSQDKQPPAKRSQDKRSQDGAPSADSERAKSASGKKAKTESSGRGKAARKPAAQAKPRSGPSAAPRAFGDSMPAFLARPVRTGGKGG